MLKLNQAFVIFAVNTLIAFIVFVSVSFLFTDTPKEPAHKCIDSKHITCDGACVCDGMECKY